MNDQLRALWLFISRPVFFQGRLLSISLRYEGGPKKQRAGWSCTGRQWAGHKTRVMARKWYCCQIAYFLCIELLIQYIPTSWWNTRIHFWACQFPGLCPYSFSHLQLQIYPCPCLITNESKCWCRSCLSCPRWVPWFWLGSRGCLAFRSNLPKTFDPPPWTWALSCLTFLCS